MDLPVKGNISSPEFSYRKLIFKTLTNLLVNVAMSPISFMANSLGLSPDKLEAIPLDACQWDFTSEQYTTLNDLVTILKSKPETTLVLEQEINLSQAKEELAMYTPGNDITRRSTRKKQIPPSWPSTTPKSTRSTPKTQPSTRT